MSLSSLDHLISKHSLLQHAFYVKWSKGELTLEDMRVYAKEYFHFVKAVPDLVQTVINQLPSTESELRVLCEKNRSEEQEHVALWERFALSLGISVSDLNSYIPSQMMRDAVTSLETLASSSFEDAVTVMYTLEKELPEIARTKKEGLLQFYGLSDEDAHAYFNEHEHEEEHLTVWRNTPVEAKRARKTAKGCLSLQNQLLDSVCVLRNIPLTCQCEGASVSS